MELNFTDNQLTNFVDVILGYWCKEEIRNRLYENDYLSEKCIEDLSSEEFQEAVRLLHDKMYDYIIDGDWGYEAMRAIDTIVAERPKEEPKPNPEPPDAYYSKVLEMYGLTDGDAFKIKGIPHIYHFDGGDLLYTEGLEDETATLSDYTLAQFLFEFKKEDIELVKPEPKDLLNDTLKLIGLETMEYFKIDDEEFKDQYFCIDSFGDVFKVNHEPNCDFLACEEWSESEHEYLTLGRILTQYHDKIIPIDKEV